MPRNEYILYLDEPELTAFVRTRLPLQISSPTHISSPAFPIIMQPLGKLSDITAASVEVDHPSFGKGSAPTPPNSFFSPNVGSDLLKQLHDRLQVPDPNELRTRLETTEVTSPTLSDTLDQIEERRTHLLLASLDARAELESNYSASVAPLLEQRKELISTIPDFWVTCFRQLEVSWVTEQDLAVLSNLQDVLVTILPADTARIRRSLTRGQPIPADAGPGFKIELDFRGCPLMTAASRRPWVSYRFDIEDGGLLQSVEGSAPRFNDDSQDPRVAEGKTERSFFHLFTPPTPDDLSSASPTELQALTEELNLGLTIATTIRARLARDPLSVFNGEEE
eukprot:gnl/Dysnectes_brevis/1577_a1787_1490.p1 GENE.gnl/Dysnectes_brevis/1577_a1787_1490~~gnl/Dysnectes_brevis/1577_a1787_1490.p1  ORF type:complete len:337 (+),score=104.69 gnl/Dysnectes_brevis/1577_a1787_1490:1238-2248(+)